MLFRSPSESPTLNIGDRIIVNKASYAVRLPYSDVTLFWTRAPERGDMVLVRLPNGRTVAPKRVVGLPQETIELRENGVFVNGRKLPVRPLNRAEFNWVNPTNRIGSVVAEEGGHSTNPVRSRAIPWEDRSIRHPSFHGGGRTRFLSRQA